VKVHRIAEVKAEKLTRTSAMKFNEANVRRPLASAVQVAKAGNLMVLDEEGGYIENKYTKEKMKVRVEKNTYVFDVQVEGGESIAVTLDSGAGCSVWPRGWCAGSGSKLLPKTADIRMVAANGTDIPCYGQRIVRFRGVEASDPFQRPM
jgi:ABC-type microcin C transport system duplicated ATPase subunit YejF